MIRIAFVKYVGLASGGTERWLQAVAAHLPRDEFSVDFFYADAVPYIGSADEPRGTDPERKRWMEEREVRLVEFHLDAVDVTRSTKPWIGTDFWELFDSVRYDLVQTAKAGPAEYPFTLIDLPVVECVTYNGGVDHSANTVLSIHLSQWQRGWWVRRGGDLARTSVAPVPVTMPVTAGDMRAELGIPPEAVVAGFHQRPHDGIFSPVQLEAFSRVARADRHFVVLGGSERYAAQVADLGIPNVHFLRATAEDSAISRFLNTLDVMAHGRRDGETFGSVFGEAMAHGVPCISHRVVAGGNAQRETIGPGGFVVDTVDEYASTLDRVLGDPDLRSRLGAKARKHAEERYSLDAVVSRMASEYRQLVAGEPPFRPSSPIAYGEVPGGLLIAGDVESPVHPAHAVLSDTVPRGRQVALLRAVLNDVGAVVEVGADRPVLALYAARFGSPQLQITVIEAEPGTCAAARASLALNNWEERVDLVHTAGCPSDVGHAGGSATVQRLLSPDEGQVVLSLCAGSEPWLQRHPVLGPGVAHVALEDALARTLAPQLRAAGYRMVNSGGWAVHEGAAASVRRLQSTAVRTAVSQAVARTRAATVRTVAPARSRLANLRRAVRARRATVRRVASDTVRTVKMAGNLKSTLRSAALWVAPHGVIEAARHFRELRDGGVHSGRAVPLALSRRRRNNLTNTRLGLLPPAALDELDVIVDVGANVGDWTAGVLAVTAPRRLIALEPAARLAEGLRARFGDHPEVEVVAAAAGAEDGTVQFNITSHSHNSSVLRAREEMSEVLARGIAVVQTVEVPQVRLDTLLAGTSVSLLKIDVQGYERAVLAGAGDVLQRTQWVLLEANFVSHYEGDTLLPELHQTMVEAGFELSNLSQPLVARGQALYSDALYRRRRA